MLKWHIINLYGHMGNLVRAMYQRAPIIRKAPAVF